MGMCVAVPDADWLKQAIGTWSNAHIHEWQRMFDTLFYKYNPLWNKDATINEDYTDYYGKTDSNAGSIGTTGNTTATGFTHGYNDGEVQSDDGLKWTHADKTKGNSSTTTTESTTRTYGGNDRRAREVKERGNIGVTMVQVMIEKERELAKFNIEEFLADEFKKTFCLMIW